MISAQKLRHTIQTILDGIIPKNFNPENAAKQLMDYEDSFGITLSEYGFVMYVLEHAGVSGIYHGRMSDPVLMEGYAREAKKYREDMPTLLVNASKYADKVFSVIQDPDLCMPRLAGMSFPYVLFVLFAGTGNASMVEMFREETKELLARYPDTLSQLPENFIQATKEALADADIQ